MIVSRALTSSVLSKFSVFLKLDQSLVFHVMKYLSHIHFENVHCFMVYSLYKHMRWTTVLFIQLFDELLMRPRKIYAFVNGDKERQCDNVLF